MVINGQEINWVSPSYEGVYEITCTVIDNYGGEYSRTKVINLGSSETGYISGSVKDAITHSSLPDVLVEVYAGNSLISSGQTNYLGSYYLEVPAGSNYRVEFSKLGYISAQYYNISVEYNMVNYLETVLQIDETHSGTGNVAGRIIHSITGNGVSNLTIGLREGINATDGVFVKTTQTGSDGIYSFSNLAAGYYTAEVSGTGYNTTYFTVICVGGTITDNQDATVSPILSEDETRIILTWGLEPRDLDSHLTGPSLDDSRFHVYYAQRIYSYSGITYADLDRDDVDSYGPETTTIYQQIPGLYRFSVHDYSNRSSSNSLALSNSGAQVNVYKGCELVRTFNVPSNQEGTLWTVFEMDGDNIVPINSMSYESSPSIIRQISRSDAELMINLPQKK